MLTLRSPRLDGGKPGAVDLEFLPLQTQARLGTPNPKTVSILKLSGRAAYTSGRGGRLAGKPSKIWVAVSFSQFYLHWIEPATRQLCPTVAGPASEYPLQPVRCSWVWTRDIRRREFIALLGGASAASMSVTDRRLCTPDAARAFIAPVEESLRWHPDLSRLASLLHPSFPTSKLSSRK
jgi:hypothetical protein